MVFLIELWILALNFIGGFSTQFFPVRKSLNNCSTDAATREEIEGAEQKIGLKFSGEFKEYLAIDGIIICQDESGSVHESTPNNTVKKVADSLADYVLSQK